MIKISLAAARVNAGFTQQQVAEKLNKTKQTIVNWELGRTTIDPANLAMLADLYEISVDNIRLIA